MSDERAFLQAILEQPGDDARKLAFADWLEERGDPRAEYLRLMMKVRQERVVTPEQRQRHQELSAELAGLHTQVAEAWRTDRGSSPENRERQRRIQALEGQLADLSKQVRQQVPARLQELTATLDSTWLAVVSDPQIEGCGKNAGDGWRLYFDFVCDKTWADMEPTKDGNVRHCEACDQKVHFCDNLADAREHSRGGHCISCTDNRRSDAELTAGACLLLLGSGRDELQLGEPGERLLLPGFPHRPFVAVQPVTAGRQL